MLKAGGRRADSGLVAPDSALVPPFTVLGRGYDTVEVARFCASALRYAAMRETLAELLAAHADAAEVLRAGQEQARLLELEAAASAAAVHEQAMAEVERIQAACGRVGRLVDDLDLALIRRTVEADPDLEITLDVEHLADR